MDDAATRLVDFATSVRYEDLSPNVVAAAKRNILDTLMVACAGAQAEGVDALVRLAEREAAAGECSVLTRSRRLPAAYAAQINAMAAAALDFDSLCLTVHADCVVAPAALAVAEEQRQSGRAFLTACIVGAEIVARLSRASISPQKGWTHTAVFGVFGAAAASARLAGLSQRQLANAFGICLSLAAGTQQSNIEQALTKRMQPALAARSGVFAAYAAQAGISGPISVLEGKAGLWALYQNGDREKLIAGLGRDYVMLETGLKKYPVCACSHAAIEACLFLTGGQPLIPEQIERVEVTLTPFMSYMVGGAFDPASDPVVSAQFSVRYAVGVALLYGRLGLPDLDLDAIKNPDVKRLADRIVIHTDELVTGDVAPAVVCLKLKGGKAHAVTVDAMPGSATAPLSEAEFDAKLRACALATQGMQNGNRIQRLRALIGHLEDIDDLGSITELLV